MSKVIILKGLPASGKSTWALDIVYNQPNYIRINKDDLRAMFHNSFWSHDREKIIVASRDKLIQQALSNNLNVIVDDTNFNPRHEKRIREIAKEFKAEVEVKFFNVSLTECLERNANRTGKAKVPDNVIIDMYEKYVKNMSISTEPIVNIPTNPHCIVCDLDGTLALMNGKRSAYEFHKVYQDEVNEPVWECLNSMRRAGFQIVFVSGREDSCRSETERWLADKCGLTLGYPLFMRKTGDRRKDSVVKEEIYRNFILPKYYVEFVLDDRNQVVDHLRELGLTVFQVAPGDF